MAKATQVDSLSDRRFQAQFYPLEMALNDLNKAIADYYGLQTIEPIIMQFCPYCERGHICED